MTTSGKQFRRLLAAAAVLASLTLAACGDRFTLNGNGASSGATIDWGSGWGGNRDWGGGWGNG